MSDRVKVCAVYAITHSSGKVYIGASVNARARWRSHQTDLERGWHVNKALQVDWNQDGPGAFRFELLSTGVERCDLAAEEGRWIDRANDVYNVGRPHQNEFLGRHGLATGYGEMLASEPTSEQTE